MEQDFAITGPHKDFESIKKIDENGIEYWLARELMLLLGYEKWQNFEELVGRAARAGVESGQVVDNHFTHFMVGGKVRQTIKDIGGVLPEKLPVEKHIKEIKKKVRKLKEKS